MARTERTDDEIIADIANTRKKNKTLYKRMEDLVGGRDATLEIVALSYHVNRKKARKIHKKILRNDEKIMDLSRELMAKTCE